MAGSGSPTREGITRGVLIAFFILMPVYFLIFSPQSKDLEAKTKELAQVESELRNAQQVARTRDDLRKVTKRLETILEFYEKRLPSEESIPGLLEELQDVVTKTKVQLQQIDMLQRQMLSGFEKLPFKLQIKGGYHDLGRLINSIEKGKRFMSVNRIAIEGEGTASQVGTFEVSTFRFVERRG